MSRRRSRSLARSLAEQTIAEAIRIARLYRTPAERSAPGPKKEERPPPVDAGRIFDELSARVEEIKREGAGAKLASGWAQDEDGNWIPPGWVRRDGAA